MDKSPNCDVDTVYVARFRDTDHCKIGLTSSRRGLKPLSAHKLDQDIVLYAQLRWDASILEEKLLALGEPIEGEVRRLSMQDLERATFLVSQKILEAQQAAS